LPLDLEFLRQHYADLSDEGLRAIDRSGLVQAAQACYDEELARRAPWGQAEKSVSPPESAAPRHPPDAEKETTDGEPGPPDWLEQAACVGSFVLHRGTPAASLAESSRDVLRAAGIPCCLVREEIAPAPSVQPAYTECRVMVPGAQNLHAVSVLDRQIFNAELEAEWRAHFEELSDEEFRALSLDDMCAGLLDRVERLKRAYGDEVARRGSARSS
jgi:hypothetical protein